MIEPATDSISGELTSATTEVATIKAVEHVPAPAGGPVGQESWRRFRAICQVEEAQITGVTQAAACRMAGVDKGTYCRWLQRLGDMDWRDPQQRQAILQALAPGRSTGRPCRWEMLLDLSMVRTKLDTLYLATLGASSDYMSGGRRTAKVATALLRFAEEDECPHDLASELRRGYQPIAFVRYLRRITPEQEARIRGAKHFLLHGVQSRRDMTVRLTDGRRAELPAGFLWELDDMSANQPFYVDGPAGPMFSRQGLYARDVKSGRWLGVDLVARAREAYRAEDILRYLRRLMQIHGKPDMLRLEQGIWRSRKISGYRVTETGAVAREDWDRPSMSDAERKRLQNGLEAIGVEIQWATSAHRKGGIESGFCYLQTVLATYTTDLVNIGRHAGEIEHGAKQLRRVRAGSHHPSQLSFAGQDELANRIERAMVFCNAKTSDRLKASPDDVWSRETAARPLPQLERDDLAVFLPDLSETMVRGGLLSIRAGGQQFEFRAPQLVELGTGYRVYVRFDASEPSLGAAIYNRDGSSANHQGYGDGELICWADYEIPGPQATVTAARGMVVTSLHDRYGVDADPRQDLRKAQLKLVRTAFRGLPRPGQPAVRVATARDGRGAVSEARQISGDLTDRTSGRSHPTPTTGREVGPRSVDLSRRSGSVDANLSGRVVDGDGRREDLEDLEAATSFDRGREMEDTTDAVEEITALFTPEPSEDLPEW